MSRGGDDFLSRWSRRKLARDGGEPVPGGDPAPETAAGAPRDAVPDAPDERSDEEILAELGLPDPDQLAPGDDVRGFMAKAVPERLRRRALRRLWTTNPVLANLDGLVDYDEDFTDAATVIPDLATAWKVGQGFFRPEPETAPDRSAGEGTVAAADPAEAEAIEAGEPFADARPETPAADPAPSAPEAARADAGADEEVASGSTGPAVVRPGRRSMRFSFERG